MPSWDWETFKPTIKNISHQDMRLIDALSELQVERLRQNISKSEFSNRIGISLDELNAIEALEEMPTIALLEKYATGLGRPLSITDTSLSSQK